VSWPQLVMMTVPGQSAPVMFTAQGKAGSVANLTASKMTDLELTLLTISYNRIGLMVKDAFGNPIVNSQVKVLSPVPDSGIEILPGESNGISLSTYMTDERGMWLGSIKINKAIPTIDEFGRNDTPGLATPYQINLQVDSKSILFNLDINMGPTLTTPVGNHSALIGQPLPELLKFIPVGFMRDIQSLPSSADEGIWSNVMEWGDWGRVGWRGPLMEAKVKKDINWISDFSELRAIYHKPEPIHYSIINYQDEGTEIRPVAERLLCKDKSQDATILWFCNNLTAYSQRQGEVEITNIGDFHSRSQIRIKAVIPEFTHGVIVGESLNVRDAFVYERKIANLTSSFNLYPQAVSLSFVAEDVFKGVNRVSDVYPGIPNVSGIDLNDITMTLPDGTVINAEQISANFKLNQSPNFAQLWLEHHRVSEISSGFSELSPKHFQLIYEPNASQLKQGLNTIKLIVQDEAGNQTAETSCTFNYPTSIQCQE